MIHRLRAYWQRAYGWYVWLFGRAVVTPDDEVLGQVRKE